MDESVSIGASVETLDGIALDDRALVRRGQRLSGVVVVPRDNRVSPGKYPARSANGTFLFADLSG